MNRLVLHHSAAGGVSPVELVDLAHSGGFDSVGLRVAAFGEVDRWWHKGVGSETLPVMVNHLLTSRVTVLDVGRIPLVPGLHRVDFHESYQRVLDLGVRLGAQFVTACAVSAGDEIAEPPADLFAVLVDLAAAYRLTPVLVPASDTPVDSRAACLEIVRRVGGRVVLDLALADLREASVDELLTDIGDHLAYIRLSAAELLAAGDSAAGLLATVPAQVPIAVGATENHAETGAVPTVVPTARQLSALRRVIDAMLEHPEARAARLA